MRPLDHLMARALSGDADYVRAALRDNPGLLGERDMFGSGVAHAAVYGGHPELLELPEFSGWSPDVITAAELGDTAAVGRVLAADPALAAAFVGATTALHAAAHWGQPAVARLLLDAGAGAVINEPTRDDFLQITALGSAVATTPGVPQPSDREDIVLAIVRLLLEHGAEVNARRRDGMTPLHTAAWRGHAAVAAELLGAGADPAATAVSGPPAGQTPADTALSQGHLVLADRLDTQAPAAP